MRSSASAGPSSRTQSWIRRAHAEDRRADDAVPGRLLRGAGPRPELASGRRGVARARQRAARDHERLRGGPGQLRAHGSGLADRRPEPGQPADDAGVRRHLAGGAEDRVLPHAAGGRPQRRAAGRGGPRRDPRTDATARRGHDARWGRSGRDLPPAGPGRRVPALRQPGRHRPRSTAVRDRRRPRPTWGWWRTGGSATVSSCCATPSDAPSSARGSGNAHAWRLPAERNVLGSGLRSGVVTSPEREFVSAHLEDLRADLDAWLRIPSISADPAHASDVARSAEWLAEALRRVGFPTVEIWPTPGAPAVYAEWQSADPGAPVALVYGHHDVQPVAPLELWVPPPFEPTVLEGPDGPELHARGAIDDKGNVAMHLLGMRAHLAAAGRDTPAVTVKLLVEGEEESGSRHFAALLKERRARLDCDIVVVSGTGMAAPHPPRAVVSLRGAAGAEITLRGPAVDLHSGSFGGAVPNPLHAMAELLAGLHDGQGRVTLPGFYDKVRPLSDRERELMGRVPFDEQAWLAGPAAGSAAYGEAGFSTLERIGARPTAEVNGMWGGYQGPGHKTIIPAEAHAKITFRLVADQRPEEIGAMVQQWVAANLPAGVEADVHVPAGGVAPCSSDLDSPWMAALLT